MNKIWAGVAIMVFMVLLQCQKEEDKNFLIGTDYVGNLERDTEITRLQDIFAQDSIVKDSTVGLNAEAAKIKIYEKGGALLLTLTPSTDSIPTVENIRIHDPRFRTVKGVSLNSSFKDIKDQYAVRKIVTSSNNLVIFLKENDIYFTIAKDELPASLRYATSTDIEEVQIPDKAKIKYMMLGWE